MRHLILILLFILISCQGEDKKTTQKEEKTPNERIQASPITYSENWSRNATEIEGVDFVILYKDKDDNFRENINLMTEELRAGTTLDKYTQLTIDQLRQIDQKEIISQNSINLDGHDAQILEFKANLTGQYLYYYQQYMIANNTAYVLTFSSDIDDASALLPEVKEIFKSFKIPD